MHKPIINNTINSNLYNYNIYQGASGFSSNVNSSTVNSSISKLSEELNINNRDQITFYEKLLKGNFLLFEWISKIQIITIFVERKNKAKKKRLQKARNNRGYINSWCSSKAKSLFPTKVQLSYEIKSKNESQKLSVNLHGRQRKLWKSNFVNTDARK